MANGSEIMASTRVARVSIVAAGVLVLMACAGGAGADQEKAARGVELEVPEWASGPVKEAKAAFARRDFATAERLLGEVLQKEPGLTALHFGHAGALARLGKAVEAIEELDKALGPDPSFDALIAAGNVTQGGPEDTATALTDQANAYYRRAMELALSGEGLEHASLDRLALVASLALRLHQDDRLTSAVAVLRARFPGAKETHYFHGLLAAKNQSWLTADNELERARALGMPMDAIDPAQLEQLHALARPWRYARLGLYSVVAVAGGLALLFVLGRILSFLTLRSAETADPNLAITPLQRSLRRIYRLVINLAGFYYYICLPFVILIAIGIVIGLGYILLMLRRIPGKAIALFLAFGCAMLVMIWSSIRSLFVRMKYEDPGRPLTADEAPRLWELTRAVAAGVGTRPVDAIFLTPGTELAVFERGNWLQRTRDQSKRSLILGLGVIDGFRTSDFRAVLAHEYGHFLHRDTAGGDVALRVNATMTKFATAMAQNGQLAWWNIGWQFVRLYHLIFRRITHGASRLQEINADRVAARLCGRDAFEGGLRHVIHRDLDQNVEAGRSAERMARIAGASSWSPSLGEDPVAPLLQLVEAARDTDREPWWDVYSRAENRREIDQKFDEIWKAGTSEDDTHPSPTERVRLLSRLHSPAPSSAGNGAGDPGDGEVAELFADPAAIRTERSSRITQMAALYVAQNRFNNLNAIQQINAYLAEHPGLRDPLEQRVQAKLALRDFAAAEADASDLIAREGPKYGSAYYLRGLARSALGKNDEAIADLRVAIERDERFALIGRSELGDALMQAGRPAEAATAYAEAIEIAPDALGLYLRRGDAHTRAGCAAEAEADFGKALELDPRCAEALALRAVARAGAGRHEEAEADARAALCIDGGITDIVPALGAVLHRQA
jgi:tetratricopeptide (TPR) repeat protein